MSNPSNESQIDSGEASADLWELHKELAEADAVLARGSPGCLVAVIAEGTFV